MSSHYEKRILRVLQYVHENPAEDLSLDNLADVAAMSRFHWHRVFHAMTGETCAQAVRRLRMFRAARWLESNDWPVSEIAARVGYDNVNSFARAFKEDCGMSPKQFREMGHAGLVSRLKIRGDFKMFDVEMTQAPQRRLAAMNHNGAYNKIGSLFQKIAETATAQNLWPRTSGAAAVYFDDPNVVAEKDLRSAGGLILTDTDPVPDEFEEIVLAGGEYAVLHYKGPYESIGVAYDHLYGKWLAGSGREPADAPCYEIYLNDPSTTAPEDLLTDIYLPLTAG